jgi:hypothetical protein
VYGVKKVEGRPWYTSHRGRLWIASAAKQATAEDVRAVVDAHRAQHRTHRRGNTLHDEGISGYAYSISPSHTRTLTHSLTHTCTCTHFLSLSSSLSLSVAADAHMVMPEFYPTGCLLGCVDVVACLSLAEYRAQVRARTPPLTP